MDEVDLTESLRLARRELKFALGRQEAAQEALQRSRRQRANLREQLDVSSTALARMLSEGYWAKHTGAAPAVGGDDESDRVAAIEASDLFDGAWYVRAHPDVLVERLSPALHYLRVGGLTGAEPGPGFDTEQYLRDHPEARDSDLPPLLHQLRRSGG